MTVIRALIVDDEPLARERIRTLLAEDPEIEVLGECGDGGEAVERIAEDRPDLLFLDVQMPEVDGFAVLRAIDLEPPPTVIFVTAFDQYALQAFDVHALDYLLKPFDRERFETAVERAKEAIDGPSPELGEKLAALVADLERKGSYRTRLVVKSGGRVVFLRVEEIDWIEAAGNYVRLHVGTESHLLRGTMKSMEEELDPEVFHRIHRSTIVNIDRIDELHPMFHGEFAVLLEDGTELTLSRTYRKKLEDKLQRSL